MAYCVDMIKTTLQTIPLPTATAINLYPDRKNGWVVTKKPWNGERLTTPMVAIWNRTLADIVK